MKGVFDDDKPTLNYPVSAAPINLISSCSSSCFKGGWGGSDEAQWTIPVRHDTADNVHDKLEHSWSVNQTRDDSDLKPTLLHPDEHLVQSIHRVFKDKGSCIIVERKEFRIHH